MSHFLADFLTERTENSRGGPTGDSPHDGTHIPGQVPATGGGGEVLLRVEPVRVDHEVPVGQVSAGRKDGDQADSSHTERSWFHWCDILHLWSFGLVFAIEELR